jgi:hypothetical protein
MHTDTSSTSFSTASTTNNGLSAITSIASSSSSLGTQTTPTHTGSYNKKTNHFLLFSVLKYSIPTSIFSF